MAEFRRGAHHAKYFQHAVDAVEIAEIGMHVGDDVDRRETRIVPRLLKRNLGADQPRPHMSAWLDRPLPRHEEETRMEDTRHIARDRHGRRRQDDTETIEPGVKILGHDDLPRPQRSGVAPPRPARRRPQSTQRE
jgi:hypothetical protein